MSEPFVAEIRIFGFNFAPYGWAQCNGQFLPISQNTALFSLLGTNYGGDGVSTFGLPNLQGAVAIDAGQGVGLSPYAVGQRGGSATVAVLQTQMPNHTHNPGAHTGRGVTPHSTPQAGDALTVSQGGSIYGPLGSNPMAPNALSFTGSSQPHNNMMPFLVLNYCIALQGIYPPRS